MIQPFLQPQEPPKREILSVSELNRRSKEILESSLGSIWLTGEISNLTKAASGHWYFSVKDDNAQIRCAMFRFKTQTLKFSPNEGDQIVLKGKVSLYQARGDYQLLVDYMEPAGEGNLQQKLRELIQKLQAEGLFAEENKKTLPFLPKRIGVITSPSGAAIHDVLNVLERRCPMIPVIIYPTQVQGSIAAESIIKTLKFAESRNECDVLLLTRGGGSLEDLWCFNDEKLAYHIAQIKLPIVAAVGHEVDVTIAEMVADLRTPTPSAAAELLVPEQTELQQRVDSSYLSLYATITDLINDYQVDLNFASLKLSDPSHAIASHQQSLNLLKQNLKNNIDKLLTRDQQALTKNTTKLHYLNHINQLTTFRQSLLQLKNRLNKSYQSQLQNYRNQLQIQTGRLETLSPLATLNRGYIILRDNSTKKLLVSSHDIHPKQEVNVQMKDGEVVALVKQVVKKIKTNN